MTKKIQDVTTNEPSQDVQTVVPVSQPTTTHAPAVPDTNPVENGAPVAVDDAVVTKAGEKISIDVVANDTDVDGDALAVKAVGSASNGSATIIDGKAVYTPNAGFSGTDSFDYTVVDGNGGSSNGKVNVTVEKVEAPQPMNVAPIATDDMFDGKADETVTLDVLGNDTDADGDTLMIEAVTSATNGNVKIVDNKIEYTPAQGFSGEDTFSYAITDGKGGTDTAVAKVNVPKAEPAPNSAPIAVDDMFDAKADESTTLDVLGNDTDADGDALMINAATSAANGNASIVDNKIVYTPTAGFSGEDTFSYAITDGKGGTDTAVAKVNVAKTEPIKNTAPVAGDDAVTAKGGDVAVLDVLANDKDFDGDKLAITNVGTPTQGTAKLNDDGTITYTANDNAKGTDSYEYTISDGNGGTDTGTITATFENVTPTPEPAPEPTPEPHPENAAPMAKDDTGTTAQGEAVVIDVVANDTDADGDSLAVKSVGTASNGTTTINDGKAVYTPNADFSGSDSFDYTVVDGNGGEDNGNVTVTVEKGEVIDADPTDPADHPATDPVDQPTTGPVDDDPTTVPVDDSPDQPTDGSDKPVDDGEMPAEEVPVVAESGGPGEDIFGTDGDDVLAGKAGDDGFLETKGNDTVDGGAGRNQIDYLGSSFEYAITREGSTLTVVKPSGGVDTVTNVSGVYFFGDDVWKATAELGAASNNGDDSAGEDGGSDDHPTDDSGMTGDDNGFGGKDFLGTDGDDVLTGGDGNDGFLGYAGNDKIDGGAGYNQVDYTGSSSEYSITRDGNTLTVVKPNGEGTDTVTNVSGVYFFGDDTWKAAEEFSVDNGGGDEGGTDEHPVDDGNDGGNDDGGMTGGDNGFGGKDFFGTDGDDVLTGGDGNDGFLGYAGNDKIDGGAGYNQVDYTGSSSEYSITRDGNTLTVVKPNGEGTDTVTNVSGVYFFGDDTWKAAEEFSVDSGSGDEGGADDHPVDDGIDSGNDDGGMTGGDNGFGGKDFFGTDGDDVLTGGDGNDGFLGYAGNDVIDGGAGYNQVDYTGYSADYTAGIADDGTIIVVKPNGEGTDALVNVDGIYFAGDDVWKATSDLGPIEAGEEQPVDETPVVGCPYDDGGDGEEGGEMGEAYGTDGFDILDEDGHTAVYGYGSADLIFAGSGDAVLDGGDGFDVMHATGASGDYTFEANGDGSVTAYSEVDGTDTMVDMEAVYFAADDQFAMVSSLTGCPEPEPEVDACHG